MHTFGTLSISRALAVFSAKQAWGQRVMLLAGVGVGLVWLGAAAQLDDLGSSALAVQLSQSLSNIV